MQDPLGATNRRRCCVPGCNSRSVPFSFHKFPLQNPRSVLFSAKDSTREFDFIDRCEEWRRRIGIKESNENTVICSRHFTEDDYYFPEKTSKVKRLKHDAVPSVNLDLEIAPPAKKIKSEYCSESRDEKIVPEKDTEIEIEEAEDIKILKEPSAEILRSAIMDLKEPILIRNILRKLSGENIWEIFNWDLKTLAEKFGDTPLPFRAGYRAQTSRPQWEVESRVEWFTMKEFLNKKDLGYWYYFDYKYMHEWCKDSPETLSSLNWNRFGFDFDGKDSTIWVGNKGAHTNCHQDSYGCNLVAQIHGKKEWILFPPESAESLRPVRVPYEESTIYSSINFFTPSEEEENHLKNIPGAKFVILQPGEVLLVPKGWWHYVESLNLSVSANVWLPLETDPKARLQEALVKLIVNGIGKKIPSTSENAKCSVSESINLIKVSLEECSNQRKNPVSSENNNQKVWTVKSLTKDYPFFAFSIRNLNTEELQSLFSDKRNRFSTSIDNSKNSFIKQEEIDSSNQLLVENIVNAFCNLDVIEKVADSLLSKCSPCQQ